MNHPRPKLFSEAVLFYYLVCLLQSDFRTVIIRNNFVYKLQKHKLVSSYELAVISLDCECFCQWH